MLSLPPWFGLPWLAKHTAKGLLVVLQEGSRIKKQISFRVQHDIVSGLKSKRTIYKMGVQGA